MGVTWFRLTSLYVATMVAHMMGAMHAHVHHSTPHSASAHACRGWRTFHPGIAHAGLTHAALCPRKDWVGVAGDENPFPFAQSSGRDKYGGNSFGSKPVAITTKV